jgi:2-phosphoglycerate kinase
MGAHAPYITAVDLSHVLWIGGGPGSGKSSLARALAERFDLQLYAIADHDREHEPRMPSLLADETINGLLNTSRHRFRLVLEDLAALPSSPPAIVEGVQLLPTSVAAVLRDPARALFLLPVDADDLTQRIGWEARDLRFATLRVDVPLEEMVERAAAHFLPVLSDAGDRSP